MYVNIKILVVRLHIGSFFLKKDQHKSNSTTILLLNTAIFNRFDILFSGKPNRYNVFPNSGGTWGTHQESYKVGEHGVVLEAVRGGSAEALKPEAFWWKGGKVTLFRYTPEI